MAGNAVLTACIAVVCQTNTKRSSLFIYNLKTLISISVKRTDSVQSKRKVSSLSDRSDTSEQGVGEVSGEESPGILSDEQQPESPSDSNDSDDTAKNMPWMKVNVYV
jgi:hypothetical protein